MHLPVGCTDNNVSLIAVAQRFNSTHLDSLSVLAEDVDANDRLVEVRVCTLGNVVVQVLFVVERVKTLEDEVE